MPEEKLNTQDSPSEEAKKDIAQKTVIEVKSKRSKLLIAFRVCLYGTFFSLISFVIYMVYMPGSSYKGAFSPLQKEELVLKKNLKKHVYKIAGEIGMRNIMFRKNAKKLSLCVDYLKDNLASSGYEVQLYPYKVWKHEVYNIEVVLKGRSSDKPCVVIGAHYDSFVDTAGANDNGSGTAGVLELARLFSKESFDRDIRFVLFVNEEPPFFKKETMGSYVYAKMLKDKKIDVFGMISLETIGVYFKNKKSQKYPVPILNLIYPDTGDFIGFVGNVSSANIIRRGIGVFRENVQFPSEGAALIESMPGISWSDHWSFWQFGYDAYMVTDTAPFRDENYHKKTDTPDQLDYDSFARVVWGLHYVVKDLASRK